MTVRRTSVGMCSLLGAGLVVACKTTTPEHAVDGGGSGASGSPSGVASATLPPASDQIRPVYPLDAAASDPLATRLCTALQETPAKRRAACCSTVPGVIVTSECVRMLSAAL